MHIYIYLLQTGMLLIQMSALQVVLLHHMMSKAVVKARPAVLWCYKKELGFSRYYSLAVLWCYKKEL